MINYNLTIFGNPTFIEGPTGGNALRLNGENQFAELTKNTNECIHDFEQCPFGLTISFDLKIFSTQKHKKTYIFSNGGNEDGSYGMEMWIEK